MTQNEVLIRVAPTPNPNAWKFVLDRPVLIDGKASYASIDESFGNTLAIELLKIDGVKHIHFFANVITVTNYEEAIVNEVNAKVTEVIQRVLPNHDPSKSVIDDKKASRKNLPEDIQKIEEILDRTIRPGLQGDGGDIEVIKFENEKLYVHYQGACGTCPSATEGTLMAIQGIMQDEFRPGIEVIPL